MSRVSGGRFLLSIKTTAARYLDRNPRWSFAAYGVLVRCPWLLPHDTSYLGLRTIRNHLERTPTAPTADRLILDVGANNGISSRGFLKLLPNWRVTAIEANHVHAERLDWVKRRARGRFDFIIAAAGNPQGTAPHRVTLYTPVWRTVVLHTVTATERELALNTAIDVWHLDPEQVTVRTSVAPLLAIDDMGLMPTIVKLDAEGSEGPILRGMRRTIDRQRPVILMEVTAEGAGEAAAILAEAAYEAFRFDPARDRFVPTADDEAAHVTGSRNRYFIPSELVQRWGLRASDKR
jgi:FkbM family methyltransferase